jgi:hypothetical protein
MARRPRRFAPHATFCEVQRTVDRQFIFKPDPVVRNIIGAAAARAMKRFPIQLYWLDCNINHKQTGVAPFSDSPDHLQHVPCFHQLFNSLVARDINRYLDREGPLYSSRNRSEEAVDDASLEQQLLYAVTNPVKDCLVDRVAHWKGVSSYRQLATGEVDRYTYIDWTAWHRAGGKRSQKPPEAFTKTVELELTPLPSWAGLPAHRRQTLFRRRVRELEQDYREQREREGRRVMGKRKLEKVDPRSRPKTRKPRTPQPLCHASTVAGRREFEAGWRAYLEHYYYASSLYLAGVHDVKFPLGSMRPPLISVCT